MPKFEVLGGRWGEGWVKGDIIELDDNAAKHRLWLGEIIPVNEDGTPDETAAAVVAAGLPVNEAPLEVVDPAPTEPKQQGQTETTGVAFANADETKAVKAIDGEAEREEYRSMHPRHREMSDMPATDFLRTSSSADTIQAQKENPELVPKLTRDPEDEMAL